MNDAQIGQAGTRWAELSTRDATGNPTLTRTTRALGLGAVAFGALALGATAIGALAIDYLEVRRLHVGELTIERADPR